MLGLAAAVVSLSACGTEDLTSSLTGDSSAPTRTVTATEVAPSTTPLPATTTITALVPAADASATGDAGAGCAPDIGTGAAAARDSARIPQPRDGTWHAYNAGGAWCPGLSWIELDRANAMAAVRERQLLIYHGGRFQGTGIACTADHGQYVLATAPDAITVRYSYPDVTDPAQQTTQNPVGKAVVTFRWNGSRIVMDGSLPYAFTKGAC